ncbi:acyl-CoA thioesterase [Adhaeribacter soli]|uniref:Thioesterase n=1 Tax=Adhaeribacter soli TaxID=2607655 RepID=A0A5N1J3G7_9BACT|nr:thioesterase family protein [Adhaeribacter soli]KAA9340296.1 thioesterase [Adhaeribacter soli]
MARIQLQLPAKFSFQTEIPVRITDLNYGAHLGNDALLSMVHEARVQYLKSLGYSELNLEGAGLIMADSAIIYKGEGFYGDVLTVKVAAADLNKYGFDLYYHFSNQHGKEIAHAKTGLLCFDYTTRKLMALPEAAAEKLSVS